MKLNKRLNINGQPVTLANDKLMLELSAAGRGIVTVAGQAKVRDRVQLDIGYGQRMEPYFTGIVTKAVPAENGHTKLVIKELAFVLGTRLTISLQHATFRRVLEWVGEETGLAFVLPAGADYTDRPIPNFTSAGSGAQLLQNAGRAFNIPDFCWYQQQDGTLYAGSYQHSRWPSRPVTIDQAETGAQAGGNTITVPASPALRPGALVNGNQITRVEFDGTHMRLQWAGSQKTPQQRQMEQQYPELAAGFHLPQFGQVIAVADHARAGELNDPFRPRYAVDVQMLDENGQPDQAVPVYQAVPLPVLFGGPEQGQFQYPVPGTLVELGFAFGRADQPFIRTVLGTGWPLPDIQPGEQLQQQRAEVFQRTDPAGNHTLATDQAIHHIAAQLTQQADDYHGEFGSQHATVAQHSTEAVAGRKLIEALGAIELLAGDDIELATLANLHLVAAGERVDVTGGDYQHGIGGNSTTTIQGNRSLTVQGNEQRTTQGNTTEQITGNKTSTAQAQVIQGQSIVLGNGTHNMLALMISMMANVQEALQKLDGHTHPDHHQPPNVQGQVAGHAGNIGTIKGNLQSFTG
ncbi:hypothetical protein CGX12_11770 [Zobellella denitrificans]|uniref:hypothetical protein n=1 Tax=Zobellella denitrificans TaxID=347534 RepID=UPI000B8BBD91|nr:hypothetical protein [Zobellella denitrificans]OXS14891.1 hypothetical protein CGX12_11770 [Zobellella denitrificans]